VWSAVWKRISLFDRTAAARASPRCAVVPLCPF
jgi:hypothetical protein